MKSVTTKFRSLLTASLVLLMVLGGLGSGWAQGGAGGERAPDEPTQQVEQAESAEQAEPAEQTERPTMGESSLASQERTVPGGVLALITYIVLWVLIFGFVWIVLRRQGKLNAEIAALERRMDHVFEDFD